LDIAKAFDHVS
jgi:hypothetical protein